ncbi:MAG: hypothetical protein ACR2O1_13995 [Boseongicola sp.]
MTAALGKSVHRGTSISVRPISSQTSRASVIAWCSILAGALSGLMMGLWSFDGPIPPPKWLGGYDTLARRFLRLAHTAMFALGVLHMIVARQIAASPVRPDLDRLALFAMALGNIGMPAVLIVAAVWQPFKFLTPIPALAITTAIAVATASAIRQHRGGLR